MSATTPGDRGFDSGGDVGSIASRYTVERELGRGGMATVHLARDLRHERLVALKIMHPELAVTLGRERFLREIRVAAGLSHPHIVPLHDSGAADGALFYVMPFVEGESLRERLAREGTLSTGDTIALARQIADALAYAHERGVVHRDLKPENVLIDGSGHALVTDFGIALAAHLAGDERLTRTGVSIGTPAYMSPEQLVGDQVDARSDVWAIGCMMFEMLTGQLPPRGAMTATTGDRRVEAELRRARPDVTQHLATVVQRALAADAAARFQNGRALLDAIASGTVTLPVGQTPGRRRVVPAIGAIAGLVAVAALVALLGRRRAPDPEVLALYQRGVRAFDTRTEEGAADAMQSFRAALARDSTYAPAWGGLANLYVQALNRRFVFPGTARDSVVRLAVAALDRAQALDTSDAETWRARASVSRILDPTDAAMALRAARRAIALDSSSGAAWHALAVGLADSGDLRAGLRAWHQGVRRNPTFTLGLAFRGLGYYWRGQFDSAAVWADSAVAVDPAYLLGRSTVALVEVERGRFGRAIAVADAALRLSTGVEVVNQLSIRAVAEARAGRVSDARRTMARADSIARAYTPPPSHTALFLAEGYATLGDTSRALKWLRQYPLGSDLHFQLHLQCDPPFARIRSTRGFRGLVDTVARPGGC